MALTYIISKIIDEVIKHIIYRIYFMELFVPQNGHLP